MQSRIDSLCAELRLRGALSRCNGPGSPYFHTISQDYEEHWFLSDLFKEGQYIAVDLEILSAPEGRLYCDESQSAFILDLLNKRVIDIARIKREENIEKYFGYFTALVFIFLQKQYLRTHRHIRRKRAVLLDGLCDNWGALSAEKEILEVKRGEARKFLSISCSKLKSELEPQLSFKSNLFSKMRRFIRSEH